MSAVLVRDERATETAPPVRASTLRGMPVVSMGDGLRVGEVADLAVEGRDLRVFALVLRGRDGPSIVPFAAIQSVGPDAITLENTDAIGRPSGPPPGHSLPGLRDLVGLPVVDAGGAFRGRLKELEIDRRDGRIVLVTVESGGILGLGGRTLTLPAERVRSLGPAIVTIEAPPEARAA